jgi:hypothetical protein
MAVFSAKCGAISANGQVFPGSSWRVQVGADELDVTNFTTQGYADYITNYVNAQFTLEIYWDPAIVAGPFAFFKTGEHITELRLAFSGGGSPTVAPSNPAFYFRFPSALTTNVSFEAMLKDIVKYTITGRNKGVFYYPGSVAAQTSC